MQTGISPTELREREKWRKSIKGALEQAGKKRARNAVMRPGPEASIFPDAEFPFNAVYFLPSGVFLKK